MSKFRTNYLAMQRILILLFLVMLQYDTAEAQLAKYLVLFKDKTGTPFTADKPDAFLSKRSIERRQRQGIKIITKDLPINPAYVTQVRQTGAKVWYSSKWLNGALVEATVAQINAIKALSIVKGLEFGRALANARLASENETQNHSEAKFGIEAPDYGSSRAQNVMLGVDKMHDAGFRGETMLIGIFDSGFYLSDKNTSLKPILDEKRILKTYDFVKQETSVYEDHSHGHNVFSIMASFQEGATVGPAYKASFILFRTEDVNSESRLEEANWLFAAEQADSAGVDIISTSLGYNEFDNAADNYKYSDMNGKTALITRAANWAAGVGMVIVNAAGNEGASPWKYVAAPADADSALSIGSVNAQQLINSSSSWGPTADGRTKPDVCGLGWGTFFSSSSNALVSGSGTSYSCPMLSGMIAGFWQSQPHLSAMQVLDCIRKAGHLYKTPNNQYGYGIPTFDRATDIARRDYPILAIQNRSATPFIQISPNPFQTYLNIGFDAPFVGKEVTFTFTDLLGRTLLNQNGVALTNNTILIPEKTASGIYILQISTNSVTKTFRLVKN